MHNTVGGTSGTLYNLSWATCVGCRLLLDDQSFGCSLQRPVCLFMLGVTDGNRWVVSVGVCGM